MLTDAGYVGLAVHTVARICSAAHGDQILLSAALRDALGRARPPGIRFRGLREPQTLFQVVTADLMARFPPPRTLPAPRGKTDDG